MIHNYFEAVEIAAESVTMFVDSLNSMNFCDMAVHWDSFGCPKFESSVVSLIAFVVAAAESIHAIYLYCSISDYC